MFCFFGSKFLRKGQCLGGNLSLKLNKRRKSIPIFSFRLKLFNIAKIKWATISQNENSCNFQNGFSFLNQKI